jgi:probable HAF family extracellular repeat protein
MRNVVGYANGVNDLGDIVGTGHKTADGFWTAFLHRHGKMTELGTIGGVPGDSTAEQINIHGTVCGHAMGPAGYHGVLWDHGETTDLGDFGGGWSFCQDISDRGMAVGVAGDAYGGAHAFLWRDSVEGLVDLNARIPNDAARIWLFWGSGINWAGQITAYGISFQTPDVVEGYLLSPVSCPVE